MADHPILFSPPMIRALLREIEQPGTGKTIRKIYCRGKENDTDHLAQRLANGISVSGKSGCWEWQKARNNFGYGTLTINGRTRYAHRLSYELNKGQIPAGLHVMHDCDNPACINPDHLSVGTRSKNMADCHARGRSRIPSPRMRGEENGSAKLTARAVDDIRALLNSGRSQREIAQKFGVSQSAISGIKRGKTWS